MGNQKSLIHHSISDFIPLGWRLHISPGRRVHGTNATGSLYNQIARLGRHSVQEHFQQTNRIPHDDR